MIDPILEAYEEYERTVAPAYEVIRRARARLAERTAAAVDDKIPAAGAWLRRAVPDEPNGAEMAVEALIDQPGQESASAVSPAAVVRSGSPVPAPAPAAVSSPPGDGSPATQPPGRGRDGGEAQQRGGRPTRREAPSTSAPSVAASTLVECPDCEKQVKAQGLGTHRRQAHSSRATVLREGQVALEASKPKAGDGRTIDEDCPNGCGRHFTWKPALHSHLRHCGATEPDAEQETVTEAEEPTPLSVATREPWVPRPEATGTGPVTYGGRQRWLCGRCSAPFSTEDSRDRHQATHRVDEPIVPTGGQRIRRTPPSRSYEPAERSAVNGSVGAGQ